MSARAIGARPAPGWSAMMARGPVVLLWWWRYEAAIACAVGFAIWRADLRMIALLGVALMAPVAAAASVRQWVIRRLWCVITPHRLRVGFARSGLDAASRRRPAILMTRGRRYGERVYVLLAPDVSLSWIAAAAGTLAEACWASRVIVSASESWNRVAIVDVFRDGTTSQPLRTRRPVQRREPPSPPVRPRPVASSERRGLVAGPDSAPDKYRLRERLGSGGEGAVWLADQRLSLHGRSRVAVKILHDGSDQPNLRSWAEHIDVLRSVHHRGLVRVIDAFVGGPVHRFGERPAGRCRYIVMEYVRGQTLSGWLTTHRQVPLVDRLTGLIDVAAALDEMHSGEQTVMPVVHGDVKPGNIIVPDDRRAVLVDVGLMRIADGGGRLGRSRPYAAPELFEPFAISTPESDRFAFAATVLSVVLQAVPPHGEAGPDIAAVERLLGGLPGELRRSLVGALTCRPERRPVSLRRWLSDLVRIAGAPAL
jgi:hypothetical protein